jgi:hypothetical protein
MEKNNKLNLYNWAELKTLNLFEGAKTTTKVDKNISSIEPPTNKEEDKEFLKRVFNVKSMSSEMGSDFASALGSNFSDVKKILSFKHPEIKSIKALPKREGSSSFWFQLEVKANGRKIVFKDTTKTKGTNTRDIKSEISDKELTPSALGLAKEGNLYTREKLLSATKTAISKKPKPLKNIMEKMLDAVYAIKGRSKGFSVEIPGLNKMLKGISNADEANIMKDFGEIVSAIAIADDKEQIYFPTASNQKLIDFFINNKSTDDAESYSAKFNEGAKPSVTGLMENLDMNKTILKDSKSEKKLYEVLSIIKNNSYVDGIHQLSKHLGVDGEAARIKKVEGKKKGWDKNAVADEYSKYIACRDYLNKEPVLGGKTYASILSELVNATSNINQAYLIYKSGDTISFQIKNFNDQQFIFAFSNSSKKLQNKMAFKMT